ncbi:MAG: hypothetical protein Fur0023_13280 [Bacteroidia bacterium]
MKYTFTLIFILFILRIHGQSNELDDKYTPKGHHPLLFESNKADQNYDYPKYQIKFTPTALFRGSIVLSYEYNIKNTFSVIGIGGLNFNKDFIFMYTTANLLDKSKNPNTIPFTNVYDNTSKTKGIHPYLGGGFKIHRSSEEWERYFQFDIISFKQSFDVYTYNFITIPSNLYQSNYTLSTQHIISTIKFSYSYVVPWKGKIKLIHEFYAAAGMRFLRYETFTLTNFDAYTNISYYSITKEKANMFYFGIGYNIGLGM